MTGSKERGSEEGRAVKSHTISQCFPTNGRQKSPYPLRWGHSIKGSATRQWILALPISRPLVLMRRDGLFERAVIVSRPVITQRLSVLLDCQLLNRLPDILDVLLAVKQ